MELTEAVRNRRTWKSYGAEPLTHEQLEELFELVRWAPNHRLTEPWRFRVLGPQTMEKLRALAAQQAIDAFPGATDADKLGAVAAKKLSTAPNFVAVSSVRSQDPVQDAEDFQSSSVAAYILLLAAHSKGYASFWRSPGVLQTDDGAAIAGIGGDEEAVGLIYLGPKGEIAPPAGVRGEISSFVSYLD